MPTVQDTPISIRRPKKSGSRPLGSFAILVMRAVKELPKAERYGLPIGDHVSRQLNQACDLSTIYITLKRLQKSGHLTSEMESVTPGAKRTVRRYKMTKLGVEAMQISHAYYKHCVGPEPVAAKKNGRA